MSRRHHHSVASVECLERRDCPAVVSVVGPETVNENGGAVTLMATLSEAQRTLVEVRYMAYGTANIGADYRLAIGGTALSQSGVFRFAPGQTSLPITLTPINDVVREGDESFTFQLISSRGHTLGNQQVAATIVDDDNYTAQLLGPAQIAPGERATFTLQLSSPATKNETFYVSTRDGTANSKDDYYPIRDLPVTVTPGQSAQSFTLPGPKPNTASEFDEFYQLTVRPASAGFPAIPDFGVLIPGIGPEPAPTISIGNASRNEGNTGTQTFVFEVTLSKAFSQMVTVDYATADGTATVADNDYTAASGTLTFQPGETRKTVSVSVIGDTKYEPTETFTLVLSAPTNGTVANGTGVGTIVNDDGQDGFQITVNYNANVSGNVGDRVRNAVTQAVAKWQQVITGDVPSYVNPFNGKLVDDIELDVRMGLIGAKFPTGSDGATGDNTIAIAGPLYGAAPGVNGQPAIRPSTLLPYWGTIGFDPANVDTASAGELYYYSLHEIGHALGFGGLFRDKGLVVDQGTVPVYRGTNAVAAYNQIFQRNATTIPMDSSGIPGTGGVHWDGYAMPGELMVGSAQLGGPTLSRITVGAMQDLGYQVNYAAADNYVRPGATLAARATATTTSFAQSPLSLAFALYQQLAEAKPSDGTNIRGPLQRR